MIEQKIKLIEFDAAAGRLTGPAADCIYDTLERENESEKWRDSANNKWVFQVTKLALMTTVEWWELSMAPSPGLPGLPRQMAEDLSNTAMRVFERHLTPADFAAVVEQALSTDLTFAELGTVAAMIAAAGAAAVGTMEGI